MWLVGGGGGGFGLVMDIHLASSGTTVPSSVLICHSCYAGVDSIQLPFFFVFGKGC